MKKLLGIVVLGLFLISNAFAKGYDDNLILFVEPPDSSCTLKKKNKVIEIKLNEEFNVPGKEKLNKTVIKIICKKEGHITVEDNLKFSRNKPDLFDVGFDLVLQPEWVVTSLFRVSFGTYYVYSKKQLKYEIPAHKIILPKGEGTLVFTQGKIYEGETKNGKYHGEGVLKFSNGNVYTGEFKKGKMHGDGMMTLYDGQTLKGKFKKNKFVEEQSSTECIEGNCINGQGTLIVDGVGKYIGQFKDNIPHGKVVLKFIDGDIFEGDMKNGMPSHGTITYKNGDKYIGNFKDGDYNGQGTLTHADGKIEKGIWKKGELIKSVKNFEEEERIAEEKKEKPEKKEKKVVKKKKEPSQTQEVAEKKVVWEVFALGGNSAGLDDVPMNYWTKKSFIIKQLTTDPYDSFMIAVNDMLDKCPKYNCKITQIKYYEPNDPSKNQKIVGSRNTGIKIEDVKVSWNGIDNKDTQITKKETKKTDSKLRKAKGECKELGFTKGTEKFGDCVMKMLSM